MNLQGYTIVFDLDGTLVETAPDLHRATNEILTSQGIPTVSLEDVRPFVGLGAKSLIKRGAAVSNIELDDEVLTQLTEQFVQIYQDDIAAKSYIYDNVISCLDTLEAYGARFSVCTNKKTQLAKQLLETLNIAHRFRSIVGSDTVEHKKPHKQHYVQAIEEANGSLEKSIMIGDSSPDVGTARNADVPVILVSFGYTDIAPEELNPDAIVNDFRELPQAIEAVLK